MSKDENHAIIQPENKYFHIMLNMADDELDPYQYRLLGHYVRVGTTFESTRTTAKHTKMSVGKVTSTRMELVDLGYIEITVSEGQETLAVMVLDRMLENVTRFERSSSEQRVHGMNGKRAKRSPHEQGRSPHEPKKNNNKKTLDSEKDKDKKMIGILLSHMMFLASPEDTTALTKAQYIQGANMAKSLEEFQPPVSLEELNEVWEEWRKSHKDGFTMPWNHSDFHAYIQRFRRLKDKMPQPSLAQAADEIFSSEEDKQAVIDMFMSRVGTKSGGQNGQS